MVELLGPNGRPLKGADGVFVRRLTRPGGLVGNVPAMNSRAFDIGGGAVGVDLSIAMRGAAGVSRPWAENYWLRRCAKVIGRAVASVPLDLWRGKPGTDEARIQKSEHPITRLLAKPNPWQTRQRMMRAGVAHQILDGEDIWFLSQVDGSPVAVDPKTSEIDLPSRIYAVRGSQVAVRLDVSGWPTEWAVPGQVNRPFPHAAVVQFTDYDPDDPARGFGDAESLARVFSQQHSAERYIDGVLQGGGQVGGFLVYEHEQGNTEVLEEKMREITSNAEASGDWKVLGGNPTVIPSSQGPKDLEFHEGLRWWRDSICSVLGVPLPILGVLDRATYSNYEQAVESFWEDTVLPYLEEWQDTFNEFFLRKLRDPVYRDLHVSFDYGAIAALKEDTAERIEAAARVAAMRLGISFHGAQRLFGLDPEPIEESDTVLPVDTFGPAAGGGGFGGGFGLDADTETPEDEDEDEDEDAPELEPEDEDEPEDAVDERPDEGYLERRRYFKKLEAEVYREGDRKVKAVMARWFREVELEQLRILRDFVDGKGERSAQWARDVERVDRDFEDLSPAAQQTLIKKLLVFSEKVFATALELSVDVPLTSVFETAAADMARQLGGVAIPMTHPSVLRALAAQKLTLSGVSETLANRVRDAMVRYLAENAPGASVLGLRDVIREHIPELRATVKDVFKSRAARAATIAQTETARASNGARFLQMKNEGVEKHQWITANDSAVRHSHRRVDGDIVRLGSPFDNGLRAPHDPSGPAREVINCRCGTRPIVED